MKLLFVAADWLNKQDKTISLGIGSVVPERSYKLVHVLVTGL